MMVDLKSELKLPRLKSQQSRRLLTIGVAAALVVFGLLSAKSLLAQAAYRYRVLSAKHAAINQLKADLTAVGALNAQYQAFTSANPNIIGGSTGGQGPSDGNNAQIVLDALPPRYDFPALTSSVEKILRNRGVVINSLNGSDNSLTNPPSTSPTPAPVTMNLTISAQGNYNNVQALISDFARSIRPFNINSLQLSGNQNSLQLSASLDSYYQPAKVVNLTPKVIK